jgi:hypothetical protein
MTAKMAAGTAVRVVERKEEVCRLAGGKTDIVPRVRLRAFLAA